MVALEGGLGTEFGDLGAAAISSRSMVDRARHDCGARPRGPGEGYRRRRRIFSISCGDLIMIAMWLGSCLAKMLQGRFDCRSNLFDRPCAIDFLEAPLPTVVFDHGSRKGVVSLHAFSEGSFGVVGTVLKRAPSKSQMPSRFGGFE